MKKKLSFVILLSLLVFSFFYVKRDFAKAPPTLYFNGNIITLNEENPKADAMYISDGRIVEIGELDQLSIKNDKGIKTVDLQGQTVMPGFIDVHTHFALSMFMEGMHDLSGFKHQKDIIYSSKWRLIMFIVKSIPETVFKRLNF